MRCAKDSRHSTTPTCRRSPIRFLLDRHARGISGTWTRNPPGVRCPDDACDGHFKHAKHPQQSVRRVLLPLLYAFAFVVPPLLVGGVGVARAMHTSSAAAPVLPASLPVPPAYDPNKPTAVVVAGNNGTEISDLLEPYETLATSGKFNVFV